MPHNNLSPRGLPAVAPINANEIVIMGGYFGNKDLSDVVILNTTTKACQKVAEGGQFKFAASGNQCAQAD